MRVGRRRNGHIRTGRRQVKPTAPSHVRGIREGNEEGSYEKMPGHHPDGTSTSRRSTGVDARSKNPILPTMPNLSPP